MKHQKNIADNLRKQAGIIASAKQGDEVKTALVKSITDIAFLIEENEIPLNTLAAKMYFRGITTGASIVAIISFLAMLLLK